jgi:hypothetical protein
MITFDRNPRSRSTGLGDHLAPESVITIDRNAQELQESHILPGFVFRWMKETSATGYLRFGQQPNLRTGRRQVSFVVPGL